MSFTWKQKRSLLLSLGTKRYSKPAQLPSCDVVFDLPLNRLKDAKNDVKPVGTSTFVYSDKLVYVCGLPLPKKGSPETVAYCDIIYRDNNFVACSTLSEQSLRPNKSCL